MFRLEARDEKPLSKGFLARCSGGEARDGAGSMDSWEKSYRHVRDNHQIHLEYTNREFDTCLEHIEKVLEANDGLAEYPLYVKALIR